MLRSKTDKIRMYRKKFSLVYVKVKQTVNYGNLYGLK